MMSITVPSAAATIKFGSAGAVRSGSRKKATVQKNSSKKNNDSQPETNQLAAASTAKNPKIKRASESVWTRIKRVYFLSQKGHGQGAKNEQRKLSCRTTISWALESTYLQPVAQITRSRPRYY